MLEYGLNISALFMRTDIYMIYKYVLSILHATIPISEVNINLVIVCVYYLPLKWNLNKVFFYYPFTVFIEI